MVGSVPYLIVNIEFENKRVEPIWFNMNSNRVFAPVTIVVKDNKITGLGGIPSTRFLDVVESLNPSIFTRNIGRIIGLPGIASVPSGGLTIDETGIAWFYYQ
jgi:hypothetical protein